MLRFLWHETDYWRSRRHEHRSLKNLSWWIDLHWKLPAMARLAFLWEFFFVNGADDICFLLITSLGDYAWTFLIQNEAFLYHKAEMMQLPFVITRLVPKWWRKATRNFLYLFYRNKIGVKWSKFPFFTVWSCLELFRVINQKSFQDFELPFFIWYPKYVPTYEIR